MELKVRYENGYQTISLDEATTKKLWVVLSVDDEDLAKDEKSIQEAFNKQFNRPEYNTLHKFDRHRGYTKSQSAGDASGDEPTMAELSDGSAFYDLETELDAEENYQEVCGMIRETLKPEWADLVIAVHIDGETIRDYAARIGENENNLTKKLARAEEKLKKIFSKRQI